jgi:hypothetical protein
MRSTTLTYAQQPTSHMSLKCTGHRHRRDSHTSGIPSPTLLKHTPHAQSVKTHNVQPCGGHIKSCDNSNSRSLVVVVVVVLVVVSACDSTNAECRTAKDTPRKAIARKMCSHQGGRERSTGEMHGDNSDVQMPGSGQLAVVLPRELCCKGKYKPGSRCFKAWTRHPSPRLGASQERT